MAAPLLQTERLPPGDAEITLLLRSRQQSRRYAAVENYTGHQVHIFRDRRLSMECMGILDEKRLVAGLFGEIAIYKRLLGLGIRA